MGEVISFCGARVLAGDEMNLLEGAALTAEDGQIVSIGRPPAGARQVDLSGKLLCPMFINAHCHLGDSGAKELGVGMPAPLVVDAPDGLKHRFLSRLSADELAAMMRHGMLEMLQNGIIACADFREQGVEGARALRRAAAGLPLRVRILGRMSETITPAQAEQEAHELLLEADGLGVRDVDSYDPALLLRLRREYPHKLFAAHVSETRKAEEGSQRLKERGQAARALEWSPDFLVHLTHTPLDELRLAARQGARAVACARSNGILGDGIPPVAAWMRCGLHFALGSDNVMLCAPDMLREMEYLSRACRGLEEDPSALDNLAIFKAATIEGARTLKLEDELGSLAEGKEASFIVFDLQRPNLTYLHDLLSALIHRASVADIAQVYIRARPWLPG